MYIRAAVLCCFSFLAVIGFGQDVHELGEIQDRAAREFQKHDWAAAEHDFREVVKRDPTNIPANMYLGQALFRQDRYAEAATFFQKTRDLQKSGKPLNTTQDRILTDQLVMSYGIIGEIKKAHALLDEAIGKDPDCPLNYYNRACAFAEEGDKTKALANLDQAFQRKANVLKGEQMPDPRADSSFQNYVHDPDFMGLMKKLGYQ
jgi:tetratricopeptide (TPR) repeat protein